MSIINLINFSLFNVISFSLRTILIRIINSNSSISLARESLLYIVIIKKIKAINLRLKFIKIIKKTLVSRFQLR